MKTKKDILKWWEETGRKTENNDKQELIDKLDYNLMATWGGVGLKPQQTEVTIWPARCKYPVRILFWEEEAVKISY